MKVELWEFKAKAVRDYSNDTTGITVAKDEMVEVVSPKTNAIATVTKSDGKRFIMGWGDFCFNFEEIPA